eukprot:11655629-Alexandrium_andersonii.AAC.1
MGGPSGGPKGGGHAPVKASLEFAIDVEHPGEVRGHSDHVSVPRPCPASRRVERPAERLSLIHI